MNRTINIYQTLNEREKYILDKLEINESDLKPEYASSVITIMKRMTERISELPLTDEQVLSAIQDFDQFHDIYFKGIEFIMSDEDYPDIKINVYKPLSEETKKTLKILDIKVEDREYTAKEYAEISNVLINKMLIKYGSGIKKQECIDLTLKIIAFFIIDMVNNDK
ncbi:MAG: hypothetical protein J6M60_03425 [Clostridia bacterium]|nr:hypothetical protein [Clostridia bacterium]MBP3255520.1 hypothetical protein [Clostridia bacterium]